MTPRHPKTKDPLGALVYLGYIDFKTVWEARVSVPRVPLTVPLVMVAVAADAFLLSRCIRGILVSLAGLLGISLLGALAIEATSWGAELEIRLVAQQSGSHFVAMTVTIYLALLLAFLTIALFWARLRLVVLGWAGNRVLSA